jgi:hypothetical protein
MNTEPSVVTVPCFSGAPWKLERRELLHVYPLRTMRLPKAPAERREL